MEQEVLALRSDFRPRGLRMAQLTIVATMLALPASAFAFAGATAADSPNHGGLTIQVRPAQVHVGQADVVGQPGIASVADKHRIAHGI